MSAYRIPPAVTVLKERNGAPRHKDDQTAVIVKAVTEQVLGQLQQQHREEIQAMRDIASRIEHGYTQLAKTMEAFVIGSEDLAIAAVVDGESAELPNLPRYKADPTIVYRFTATDIGRHLGGVPHMQVAYFLGPSGLNWVAQKQTLWNQDLFRMTKRRLWHPNIVGMLRDVIVDRKHVEREALPATCRRRMDEAAEIIESAGSS